MGHRSMGVVCFETVLDNEAPDEFVDIINPVPFQKRRYPIDDIHCRAGVDEIGSTDLNGRCAGNKKLQSIFGIHDPPDADDRYVNRL